MTRLNTFGMKVSAAAFIEYDSVRELIPVFGGEPLPCGGLHDEATDRDMTVDDLPRPFMHIGGGSNILFTGDFPGTIFHSAIRFIDVLSQADDFSEVDDAAVSGACDPSVSAGDRSEIKVEAGAGVVWDDFCAWCADRGLWGAENLSLIPGETGAAAVQNIGAYGAEVKDIISEVRCFDTVTCRQTAFGVKECRYAYRDSIFKEAAKGRYIVTSVVFSLTREQCPQLGYGHVRKTVEDVLGCPVEEAGGRLVPSLVRQIIIDIRRSKLPDPSETGSAGSFFKNPVVPKSVYDKVSNIAKHKYGDGYEVPHYDAGSGFVKIPAAWLIEQCGWKGYREGNAGVYEKQPLVLINATGKASPKEIIDLENKITASVKRIYDIELHPEAEHV